MGEKRFLYAYPSEGSVTPLDIGEEGFTWADPQLDEDSQVALRHHLYHAHIGEWSALFYKSGSRALIVRIK